MKLVYIVEWEGIGVLEGVVDSIDGARKLINSVTAKEPILFYTSTHLAMLAVEYEDGIVQNFALHQRVYYPE